MRFDEMSTYFERLEATSGRLEMYRLLGELFHRVDPDEAAEVAYLSEARLLPAFENLEVGMGERMVAAAIAAATDKPPQKINALYQKLGDLGLVAEKLLPAKRSSTLTVSAVYTAMLEIARTSGSGSVEKKVQLLASLITRASPRGARYLVRFAVGRLRLGIGAPTIIEAGARAQSDRREARALIERAYNLCSDLGLVLKTLRGRGLEALSHFKVRVGSPVRMMMAERMPDAEAIIARLGRCAVESKLDGFRCQVHLRNRKVEIFSRNLERTTAMFPDLVAAVRAQIGARDAIIEGEAIAIDEATGEIHPFQVTVQRKRKHGIAEMARAFPLELIAFDLLYANGKDYTNEEYETRRSALERLIKPGVPGDRIRPVERILTDRVQKLQHFFDEQIERGLEGVIAKRLDAPYSAGARNFNWIKLKRTYRGELSDTVDAVIVGYLRGRGMRARLGIGALLAAVYDAKTDTFQTIAKIGSGPSEEQWMKLRELLDKTKVSAKPARVDSRLRPDVWVEPKYVITVLADEITRSPVHTCAHDEECVGLALRFPRLVGFIREDKSPEDATTVEEIKEMFAIQKRQRKR
jgi:DNA ligase 1